MQGKQLLHNTFRATNANQTHHQRQEFRRKETQQNPLDKSTNADKSNGNQFKALNALLNDKLDALEEVQTKMTHPKYPTDISPKQSNNTTSPTIQTSPFNNQGPGTFNAIENLPSPAKPNGPYDGIPQTHDVSTNPTDSNTKQNGITSNDNGSMEVDL